MANQVKYDNDLLEVDSMTDRTILVMVRSGVAQMYKFGKGQIETRAYENNNEDEYVQQSFSYPQTQSSVSSNRDNYYERSSTDAKLSTIELTKHSYRPNAIKEDGNILPNTEPAAYPVPHKRPQSHVQTRSHVQPHSPTQPAQRGPSWRSIFTIWAGILVLAAGWSFLNADRLETYAVAPLSDIAASAAVGEQSDNEQTEAIDEKPLEKLIIAEAFVRPYRQADLGLASTGLINNIYIQEGETVTAGQVILTLDNSVQSVGVAQAKANLSRAQARWDELKAGSRSEEIMAQQAVVEAAQARLTSLMSNNIAADEQAAFAKIRAAEAELSNLYETPQNAEVVAATADLRNAEAARSRAQSAYNGVKWRNDIGALPEGQDLQTATNDYEAAQSRLDLLYAGPTGAQISQAQAQITQAQAELEQVRKPVNPGDVEAARAEIRQAEANLRLVQAGNRSEVIKFAEAEVAAAQAELLNAEVTLSQTQLLAPFNGTIVTLNAEVGEYLQMGQFVARIGDLARWQLVTDDLIELDVINVTKGAPAKIYLDSMPDLELMGRVVRTQRFGENKVGDITYTVFIEPDTYVPELAWNMTASVHIEQSNGMRN